MVDGVVQNVRWMVERSTKSARNRLLSCAFVGSVSSNSVVREYILSRSLLGATASASELSDIDFTEVFDGVKTSRTVLWPRHDVGKPKVVGKGPDVVAADARTKVLLPLSWGEVTTELAKPPVTSTFGSGWSSPSRVSTELRRSVDDDGSDVDDVRALQMTNTGQQRPEHNSARMSMVSVVDHLWKAWKGCSTPVADAYRLEEWASLPRRGSIVPGISGFLGRCSGVLRGLQTSWSLWQRKAVAAASADRVKESIGASNHSLSDAGGVNSNHCVVDMGEQSDAKPEVHLPPALGLVNLIWTSAHKRSFTVVHPHVYAEDYSYQERTVDERYSNGQFVGAARSDLYQSLPTPPFVTAAAERASAFGSSSSQLERRAISMGGAQSPAVNYSNPVPFPMTTESAPGVRHCPQVVLRMPLQRTCAERKVLVAPVSTVESTPEHGVGASFDADGDDNCARSCTMQGLSPLQGDAYDDGVVHDGLMEGRSPSPAIELYDAGAVSSSLEPRMLAENASGLQPDCIEPAVVTPKPPPNKRMATLVTQRSRGGSGSGVGSMVSLLHERDALKQKIESGVMHIGRVARMPVASVVMATGVHRLQLIGTSMRDSDVAASAEMMGRRTSGHEFVSLHDNPLAGGRATKDCSAGFSAVFCTSLDMSHWPEDVGIFEFASVPLVSQIQHSSGCLEEEGCESTEAENAVTVAAACASGGSPNGRAASAYCSDQLAVTPPRRGPIRRVYDDFPVTCGNSSPPAVRRQLSAGGIKSSSSVKERTSMPSSEDDNELNAENVDRFLCGVVLQTRWDISRDFCGESAKDSDIVIDLHHIPLPWNGFPIAVTALSRVCLPDSDGTEGGFFTRELSVCAGISGGVLPYRSDDELGLLNHRVVSAYGGDSCQQCAQPIKHPGRYDQNVAGRRSTLLMSRGTPSAVAAALLAVSSAGPGPKQSPRHGRKKAALFERLARRFLGRDDTGGSCGYCGMVLCGPCYTRQSMPIPALMLVYSGWSTVNMERNGDDTLAQAAQAQANKACTPEAAVEFATRAVCVRCSDHLQQHWHVPSLILHRTTMVTHTGVASSVEKVQEHERVVEIAQQYGNMNIRGPALQRGKAPRHPLLHRGGCRTRFEIIFLRVRIRAILLLALFHCPSNLSVTAALHPFVRPFVCASGVPMISPHVLSSLEAFRFLLLRDLHSLLRHTRDCPVCSSFALIRRA